jgi:hypothetical protein
LTFSNPVAVVNATARTEQNGDPAVVAIVERIGSSSVRVTVVQADNAATRQDRGFWFAALRNFNVMTSGKSDLGDPSAALRAAEESEAKYLEKLMAKAMAPVPPPQALPHCDTSAPPVDRAYLFGGSTCHLADSTFYQLLFDTPNALVIKSQVSLVAFDERFTYFHEPRFDYEWAFAKEPTGLFAGHAVWSRRHGTVEWNLRSTEAVMATPYPRTSQTNSK